MQISIASGKGGTGKTLVATNLALSIPDQPVQLMDCDVEEPNAHIFFQGQPVSRITVTRPVPKVDAEKCRHCGTCSEVCAFNAIALLDKMVLTFDDLCHSCGACWYLCPHKAIEPLEKEIGTVEKTDVGDMVLVTGKLKIGSHISPPVIKKVKEQSLPEGINIIDGPPGSSCPVMETVEGTDYCVLVTEPTPFGLNDLTLAVKMVKTLGVPCGVVINRDGPDSVMVEEFCRDNNIKILMRIPLDVGIAESYAQGIPLVKENPAWKERFEKLYRSIVEEVQA
ncbi:MinD superfamily P-loop ATPase [Desulfohalotomaculum tongense]|uniref:ATP-binding protein n=1 Tax=Desulforadius tongensis TaxID=1216062 RepID=UPI00195709B5|nr:ATP-binding protein [Desulforadius tongensis]MBM7853959.1 MinD superfamily P-loop ATPase [Desulforadius tongensis]